MPLRRLGYLVALVFVMVATVLVAAPAAQAKVLNGCLVITPEELEGIFEQPFATGSNLPGDYCRFTKKAGDDVPDIQVDVLVTRAKDEAKAKQQFAKLADTTIELAGAAPDVRGLGDEAFSSFFLGVDTLAVRQGRVIARVRVDEPGSDDAYGLQTVAIAEAAVPRLQNLAKAKTK